MKNNIMTMYNDHISENMIIKATEFKAKCLKLMENVTNFNEEIIITKHGKPVAKLVPAFSNGNKTLFGFMKDSIKEKGDIKRPIREKWKADF